MSFLKQVKFAELVFSLRKNRYTQPEKFAAYYAAIQKAFPDKAEALHHFSKVLSDNETLAHGSDPIVGIGSTFGGNLNIIARVFSYVHTTSYTPWPKPEQIDGVKQVYEFLLEHDDLLDLLVAAMDELDNPNGEAGQPPETLTEAQRADPLSAGNGKTGEKEFVKG